MSLGHFLMAFEGTFLFALLTLIVGVGLFKGNIASQVGELYKEGDLRRAMAFQIFYIAINVSVIVAPLISGTLGREGRLALRLRLRRRGDGRRPAALSQGRTVAAGRQPRRQKGAVDGRRRAIAG